MCLCCFFVGGDFVHVCPVCFFFVFFNLCLNYLYESTHWRSVECHLLACSIKKIRLSNESAEAFWSFWRSWLGSDWILRSSSKLNQMCFGLGPIDGQTQLKKWLHTFQLECRCSCSFKAKSSLNQKSKCEIIFFVYSGEHLGSTEVFQALHLHKQGFQILNFPPGLNFDLLDFVFMGLTFSHFSHIFIHVASLLLNQIAINAPKEKDWCRVVCWFAAAVIVGVMHERRPQQKTAALQPLSNPLNNDVS